MNAILPYEQIEDNDQGTSGDMLLVEMDPSTAGAMSTNLVD